MDDSCAVCADTLEWVAYGPCGHRDVCSTCVARLRFICDDRRCCICKSDCPVVFVTKANGLLTRVINDFSVLPSEPREGRLGSSYWYHEDTQAFFDDSDHYKMVKAMCKLSCSVCDKAEEQQQQPIDGPKRRGRFRNIDQLKGHLFHQHRLLMCSLCLEGRKVFICEQKLYSRAQLNQHINSGDSEVDGTESERGGFMGHPMCEFCRTPFYGDNELYSHMSTEHYTCHMCQRQHPGQYVYYKNYDDLEIHFGREHFLCEDEACLAKKFVVFQSETEMKRHNALEHGGRMSRSQRNAALQVPTSFRYQSYEQDNRRGRRRTFRRDSSDNPLSMAIQASLETASPDGTFHDRTSTNAPAASDHGEANYVDPIIQPFESLATTDSEPPSRYLQALSHATRNSALVESSFPPLALGPGSSSQQKPKQDPEGLPKNTMAAHLRRKNNRTVNVVNSAQAAEAWPAPIRTPVPPSANPIHTSRPMVNIAPGSSLTSGQNKMAIDNGQTSFSHSRYAHPRPLSVHAPSSSSSLKNSGSSSRMSHSSSAPNLVESGSFDSSTSDFPPVSATQVRKLPTSNQTLKVDDVKTANKSLVERMRAALQFDEDKYSAFKDISGEYRQGLIDTGTYLTYVEQFGLSHLVLELARLCPDAKKQKELVDIYNASLRGSGSQENGWDRGTDHLKGGNASKRGKGKAVDAEATRLKDNLADRVITTVRKLQSTYKPLEEEVEVLSKDGYRTAGGKSKVMADEPQAELSSPSQSSSVKLKGQSDTQSAGGRPDQNSDDGGVRSKQRKKTSKFLRARLGDGSVGSLLDLRNSDPDPDSSEAAVNGNRNTTEGLPARGVWRNGGGQKLMSMTARDPR